MFGAGQAVDLISLRAGDDQRVYFAVADGLDGFGRLAKFFADLLQLFSYCGCGGFGHRLIHLVRPPSGSISSPTEGTGMRFKPTSTRPRSASCPMSRLGG